MNHVCKAGKAAGADAVSWSPGVRAVLGRLEAADHVIRLKGAAWPIGEVEVSPPDRIGSLVSTNPAARSGLPLVWRSDA